MAEYGSIDVTELIALANKHYKAMREDTQNAGEHILLTFLLMFFCCKKLEEAGLGEASALMREKVDSLLNTPFLKDLELKKVS